MNKKELEDGPELDGPDYVALVIEWDAIADALEDQITSKVTRPPTLLERVKTGAAHMDLRHVLAGVGVLMVARWGVHRLRA